MNWDDIAKQVRLQYAFSVFKYKAYWSEIMAYFRKIKTRTGAIRHKAEIVKKKDGEIVFRDSCTHAKLSIVKKWASKVEAEIAVNGIPEQQHKNQPRVTLNSLIDDYVENYGNKVRMGRSKKSDLNRIKDYKIASTDINKLSSATYIEHIKNRLDDGVKPQTARNDVIWIGILLKFGIATQNAAPDLSQLESAKNFLRSTGLIARPDQRSRLPTVDEHKTLLEYFRAKTRIRAGSPPMADILLFALHSARRQSEITKILWADNSDEYKTGIVRDAKHPRQKIGNHRKFTYTDEAWCIAQRQPKTHDRIFPYDNRTVSANFTRACKMVEIDGLRFHDYRHAATTLAFAKGLGIHEVSQITLHESWSQLKRYTHLSPEISEQILMLGDVR